MKRIFIYTLLIILPLTSCNKWLDVKPTTQVTTDELFSSYAGFSNALNGCYIKLKARNIYGEKLTMSNIESMAQHWRIIQNSRLQDFELKNFNYDGDNAKEAASSIYAGLYNVIAQANMIINNIDTYGSVIKDPVSKAIIEGEAYAIRAFCHFDILRLFGQLPTGATINISLPYAETVSNTTMPKYYNYSEFIAKIESDLNKAESTLKDKDPIFNYTFNYLNTFNASQIDNIVLDDEFHGYRQNRFNYWAIKALQARFYLYVGKKERAYTIAKSVIEAKGADGNDLITLSGLNDINSGYLACPSECLMMLNVHDIMTYSPTVLAAGTAQVRETHLVITNDQHTKLFEGQQTASHNRFNSLWNRSMMDPSGNMYPVLMKYNYNSSTSVSPYLELTKRQVIPILRLSEMYLIVMETTNDLTEANTLWSRYLLSHNVLQTGDAFTSLEVVRSEVINEYRREFFGEGHMFYTYKRLNSPNMLWRTAPISEANYIVKLPVSEFNPNN
jgi:hypothetical protein